MRLRTVRRTAKHRTPPGSTDPKARKKFRKRKNKEGPLFKRNTNRDVPGNNSRQPFSAGRKRGAQQNRQTRISGKKTEKSQTGDPFLPKQPEKKATKEPPTQESVPTVFLFMWDPVSCFLLFSGHVTDARRRRRYFFGFFCVSIPKMRERSGTSAFGARKMTIFISDSLSLWKLPFAVYARTESRSLCRRGACPGDRLMRQKPRKDGRESGRLRKV